MSEKEAEGGAAYPVELAEGFDARNEARVGVASHRGDEAVRFVGEREDAVGEEQRAAAVGGGREGEAVEDEAQVDGEGGKGNRAEAGAGCQQAGEEELHRAGVEEGAGDERP